MSFETTSPNMGLVIPGVGLTDGPQYATDINSSLTIIDQHSHVIGQGVPITPAALNINSAVPMNNNPLTTISALTFTPQLSDAAVGSLYEKGTDLYYIDGVGNVIRITQSGSVAGASGTITGLPNGTASASYAAGVFTFQAATNTAANIDGGSFIFRNNTAMSPGLVLSPPNAMGTDYQLFLPFLPAMVTSILTLDTAGNILASNTQALDLSITSLTTSSDLAVGGNASVFGSLSADTISSNSITNANDTTTSTLHVVSNTQMDGTLTVNLDIQTSTMTASTAVAIGNSLTVGLTRPITASTIQTYGLAICRGSVSAGGSLTAGEGFSVVRTSQGIYTVTFTNGSFASNPVILCNAINGANVAITATSTSAFTIIVAATTADAPFSFIAIGERT